MTEYDQRVPMHHMHAGLVRDAAGRIDTFGTSVEYWFSPQTPVTDGPVGDVAARTRAAAAGRLRAFAGELFSGES